MQILQTHGKLEEAIDAGNKAIGDEERKYYQKKLKQLLNKKDEVDSRWVKEICERVRVCVSVYLCERCMFVLVSYARAVFIWHKQEEVEQRLGVCACVLFC